MVIVAGWERRANRYSHTSIYYYYYYYYYYYTGVGSGWGHVPPPPFFDWGGNGMFVPPPHTHCVFPCLYLSVCLFVPLLCQYMSIYLSIDRSLSVSFGVSVFFLVCCCVPWTGSCLEVLNTN